MDQGRARFFVFGAAQDAGVILAEKDDDDVDQDDEYRKAQVQVAEINDAAETPKIRQKQRDLQGGKINHCKIEVFHPAPFFFMVHGKCSAPLLFRHYL